MARQGVSACALALVLLAAVPALVDAGSRSGGIRALVAAAACMAFTSATVVNALNAAASLLTEDAGRPELAKGVALGRHRSAGQLGRAIGPLIGALQSTCARPYAYACSHSSLRCILDTRSAGHIWRLGRHDDWSLGVDAPTGEEDPQVEGGLKDTC
jgi:MFS family permease